MNIIFRKYLSIKKLLNLRYQNFNNSRFIKNGQQIKNLSLNITGDSLILIPHADDEWVGCSQIITNYSESTKLCYLSMDGGDTKELHSRRFLELNNISNKFGCELYDLSNEISKVNKLIEIINKLKPQNIFLPFYLDWHPDHIQVMKILKDSLENIEETTLNTINIYMYQVSVPIPYKLITNALPMNKAKQKKKWKNFYKVYKTQKSIPWKRFQYNEYINGSLCDTYSAEAYVKENSIIWLNKLDERILNDDQRDFIYENLQDIKLVREIVNDYLH